MSGTIDTSREAAERLADAIIRGNASTHTAAATLRALLAERDAERNLRITLERQREEANAYGDAAIQRAEKAEGRISAEERAHLLTIDQRDAAEDALSEAYIAVVGEPPEWSNLFGYKNAIDNMREHCEAAEAQRDAALRDLAAAREALRTLLGNIDALIAESQGVSGLHLNGDVATWDELTDGGRFEGWLPLAHARAALAAQPAAEGRQG